MNKWTSKILLNSGVILLSAKVAFATPPQKKPQAPPNASSLHSCRDLVTQAGEMNSEVKALNAEAHYREAYKYYEAKQWSDAVIEAQRAKTFAEPQSRDAFDIEKLLAHIYSDSGNFTRALESAEQSIYIGEKLGVDEVSIEDLFAPYYIAYEVHERNKDYVAAAFKLNALIERSPEKAELLLELARLYLKQASESVQNNEDFPPSLLLDAQGALTKYLEKNKLSLHSDNEKSAKELLKQTEDAIEYMDLIQLNSHLFEAIVNNPFITSEARKAAETLSQYRKSLRTPKEWKDFSPNHRILEKHESISQAYDRLWTIWEQVNSTKTDQKLSAQAVRTEFGEILKLVLPYKKDSKTFETLVRYLTIYSNRFELTADSNAEPRPFQETHSEIYQFLKDALIAPFRVEVAELQQLLSAAEQKNDPSHQARVIRIQFELAIEVPKARVPKGQLQTVSQLSDELKQVISKWNPKAEELVTLKSELLSELSQVGAFRGPKLAE